MVIFVAHRHPGPLSLNHLAKFKRPRIQKTMLSIYRSEDPEISYFHNPWGTKNANVTVAVKPLLRTLHRALGGWRDPLPLKKYEWLPRGAARKYLMPFNSSNPTDEEMKLYQMPYNISKPVNNFKENPRVPSSSTSRRERVQVPYDSSKTATDLSEDYQVSHNNS